MHLPSLAQIETIVGDIKIGVMDAIALIHAAPKVKAAVEANGHGANAITILQAIQKAAPEILPIVEQVANLVFPGASVGIEAAAWLLTNARPMTPAEQEAWFKRTDGSGITDGNGQKTSGW